MKHGDRNRFLIAVVFSLLSHLTAFVLLLPVLAVWESLRALFDKKNEALKVALLLAILLHLALILPLAQGLLMLQESDLGEERITVDLWQHTDDAEPPEKTPEEHLEEYEPEEEIPEGQVVRVPESKDKRPPEKETRFLSERNNRVKEETASTLRIPGASAAAPSPEIKGDDKKGKQRVPGGMRLPEQMGPPPPPELEKHEQGTVDNTKTGPVALEDINLNPSESVMASMLAGTGLDRLDDVVEGDSTAVNTRAWTFASFFNRVKEQVERYWHPDREYQRRDPYANIYGHKDRETVLLVVLRGDGSLKKAYVMDSSGVPFLDDEAREAVEQGAPFPNVPDGLKDKNDGLVKFTFHFLVTIGNQPVFRMRRY
jgi:TonB family protein